MPTAEQNLLPARMLNEFVYCPRLFYYEHVEGVFVHNADTLEGKSAHKRVDGSKGALPKQESKPAGDVGETGAGDPEVIHSRSVNLFSESLGVTAKLDLVESASPCSDGEPGEWEVRPVEYKKGRPSEGEDGPEIWPADRMQLGLQILLLRENGYSCDEGVLYYRQTRQRVGLNMTPELESWIGEQIKAARQAMTGPIPDPLAHSPKCPRCSLVSVCLPDETNSLDGSHSSAAPDVEQLGLEGLFDEQGEAALASTVQPDRISLGPFAELPEIRLKSLRKGEDIRRLIAPNEETKTLYLNTPGHWVSKKGDNLIVKEEGKAVAEFRLHDVHHLAVFGPVQLSTSVVQVLCQRDIPITWFTFGGWFYGMTRGHSLKNVFTRIEQFRCAGDPAEALMHARLFVHGKIRNQRTLLMRNHNQPQKGLLRAMKHLANAALHAHSHGILLGIEGSAALLYFSQFAGMLKERTESTREELHEQSDFTFAFDSRNRRPPRDPINALLSLAYSLLVKDCTIAAYAVGFDPYVGFLHQPRFGRPALALDLMEEFRPLIADSVALSLVNNRMITPADFIRAGKSVNLDPAARKQVFQAYEKRMAAVITHPVFGYKVSYRRALELQARLLAKCLTGEIEQYIPFLTR